MVIKNIMENKPVNKNKLTITQKTSMSSNNFTKTELSQ